MAKGIQWSNINQGAKPNDNFTLLDCIIMMIVDTILYMFLTVYIENVFPGTNLNSCSTIIFVITEEKRTVVNRLMVRFFSGEYGIPRVWYFPLTKTYWCGVDVKTIRESTQTTTMTGSSQSKRETQRQFFFFSNEFYEKKKKTW